VSQPISPTPLPDEQIVTDDLDLLLDALPPRIVESLRAEERRADLLEVVMDLGRLPEARYPGREVILSREEVTEDDLQFVTDRIGDFGGDNRAGIERTLHRISCIRNRRGKVVGLTCRVGRAVYGTIRVIEDLVISGKSILLLGKPGVGKTTMLREVARVLADDANKRVIIVDTSNEIGGDGDVPHPAIGGSRRMQVATPLAQHAVMIEAVENHMPEVIVIDEIGTELEAQAARTIAERLAAHPAVRDLRYPGLPGDASHRHVGGQMANGGFLIGFALADAGVAERFLSACPYLAQSTSFGATHSSAERRARWGDAVPEGFIRLSVGIEPVEELWRGIRGALAG